LNSNGDLLYATAIARQLKEEDDPGCHITWAVATPFKNILLHNPFIDHLWEIPAANYLDIKEHVFRQVENDVQQRMDSGEWDEVICPQLLYDNMWRYDGTIRRAVLKAYNGYINNITPVVRLAEDEVHRVQTFSIAHTLKKYKHVILFECNPLSGQSSMTSQLALEIASEILKFFPNTAFILSSNNKIASLDSRIIDGSQLTFRENAELTHYCTLLIGCSSGITWLSTSDWAKQLPMLQLSSTGINPVGRDFKREGLNCQQLVEMYRFSKATVVACLKLILAGDFGQAKAKYDQEVPPAGFFVEGIFLYLVNHGLFSKATTFIKRNLKQSNFHPILLWMLFRLPFSVPIAIWRKKRLQQL
jgi:hypothetical protein